MRANPMSLLIVALCTLGACTAGAQTVVFVDADAVGAGNGTSWADAFTAVQPALNAAQPGDHVWVAAGRYVENITLALGVALYGGFAGTEDPATFDLATRDFTAHETILDGNQAGSVVTGPVGATETTRIDGFTITNGSGTMVGSFRYGGGLFLSDSSPTIINNTIARNSAWDGGGILLDNSTAKIANNTIIGNHGSQYGGALMVHRSSPAIVNNTIVQNRASDGGAIYLYYYTPNISNTIAVCNGSGIRVYAGHANLRNNCVHGNTQYDYSGLTDPTGTAGNISVAPAFLRPPEAGPDGQWGTADDVPGFLQLGWASPCIDAGRNAGVLGTHDLDGNPRIVDGDGDGVAVVDMGAYEYQGCPADANCDGVINWRDIDYFVAAMNDNHAAWQAMFAPGTPTCPFANNDANIDGAVNWRDIDALVAAMNTECP